MSIKVICQGYRNIFKIPIILLKLFYTNRFVLINFNIDVETAMHSDLDIRNSFINYEL